MPVIKGQTVFYGEVGTVGYTATTTSFFNIFTFILIATKKYKVQIKKLFKRLRLLIEKKRDRDCVFSFRFLALPPLNAELDILTYIFLPAF